ncbi:hypothetical protein [Staphylococcus aureus]|uniref:hypothetical protein n=1 Tax=Staphylococcus aureus TaxID=1280 RepID=UPI002108BBD2|nr:hypothetical protein [Staphylococcus aureus]
MFFLACPVILGVGNLVIGPIFNKQTPFRVQVRSFFVGSILLQHLVYYSYVIHSLKLSTSFLFILIIIL